MGNTALRKHCVNAEKTGVLNVSNQKLDHFPPPIKDLQGVLRTLDISENKFSYLPQEIASFTTLKTLVVDHNMLTQLPGAIGSLTKLENFSANNNKLQYLPGAIAKLTNLKSVKLSQNLLAEFPMMLCELKHLDLLDLSNNKITDIPPGVGGLHVTELNLNQNQVSHVSEDVAECSRLRTLRLEENCLKLKSVPARLLTHSHVSLLALEGNLFDMKELSHVPGYDQYMERYTACKKKMM